jgi:DNA-binding transcriptional regulator YdaS (Cro superfamily)
LRMDFKTYYLKLGPAEREKFAKKIGTSAGYCNQIAYGAKRIELGLADAIVAAAQPDITLAELPLTERAKFQNQARQWDGKERRAKCKARGA